MSESESGPDLLNDLAHEFAQRLRRGERPALTEYTDKYPELAAEIRDLFPALMVVEKFGSVGGPAVGPLLSRRSRRTVRCRSVWASTVSCARSPAAAWASSTRPSRSRSDATSP